MTPSSSLRDKVLADAASNRARTRSQGRRRAALFFAVAALAGLPLFFVWGGVSHSAARPMSLTIGIAAGALLLAVACGVVAFWRGKSAVGRPGSALVMITLLAPIATYAWLVSWHARYAEPASRLGLRCLALTLVSGAPVLIAALYLRKRTVATNPVASGAAFGAAAGAFGSVTTDLWCPLTNSAHVLLGHAFPIVVLAMAGAIVGQRILALRSK
jgi:hypothetical protein